jgi:hypothetical protein
MFISLGFQLFMLYPKIISCKSYIDIVRAILPLLNVPCKIGMEIMLSHFVCITLVLCFQSLVHNLFCIRLPQWRALDAIKIILVTFLQINSLEFWGMSILQNLLIPNLVFFFFFVILQQNHKGT